MGNFECDEILSEKISVAETIYKSSGRAGHEKLVNCFFTCNKAYFLKWATIAYSGIENEKLLYLADMAFTDAVLKFEEKAIAGKLYSGDATIKTVFFGFCKLSLMALLQTEKRQKNHLDKYSSDKGKQINTHDELLELKEEKIAKLEAALNSMPESDRQILVWRHYQGKGCDEIALLLGINKESATNKLYRSMQRLRLILKN